MRDAHPKAEEKLVWMLGAIHGRMLDDGEGGDDRGRRSRVLRLEPENLDRMGLSMGLDGAEAAEMFRRLVRGNYVRLRGRYREGVTGRSAPAHVAGLTERGLRELERGTGPTPEKARSVPPGAATERERDEGREG